MDGEEREREGAEVAVEVEDPGREPTAADEAAGQDEACIDGRRRRP
jgi:hypothetical protein